MDEYLWETDYEHANNEETLHCFLNEHLENDYHVDSISGTMAVVTCALSGQKYEVHASGEGDFTHHKIEFVAI